MSEKFDLGDWEVEERNGKIIGIRRKISHPAEDYFLENAGIPRAFRNRNFDNFMVDSRYPSLQKAKLAILKYAEEYPAVDGGLLIMGPSGTGKTHLVVALCRKLISEKGIDCLFVDFREALRTYSALQTGEKRENFLNNLSSVELLVIDDFASRDVSDWEEDFIFRLINRRYLEELPVILTTVFRGKELEEKIGTRLRSRLYEMCKEINIEAVDYRSEVRRTSFRAVTGGEDEGED